VVNNPDKLLGYHLDLTRAMFRRDYLCTLANRLSRWGFNAVLLDIADKFQYPGHPALAHETALDAEAADKVKTLFNDRGLSIVPMLPTLGEAPFLLRHQAYASLGVTVDGVTVTDPASAETTRTMGDLMDHLIDAFSPSGFAHLGGLAWRWRDSDADAVIRHVEAMAERVTSRGLRAILWADLALAHPQMLPRLPRSVVLMVRDDWSAGRRAATLQYWPGHRTVGYDEYIKLDDPARRWFDPYVLDAEGERDQTFPAFAFVDLLRDQGFDVMTASSARGVGDTVGLADLTRHLPNVYHGGARGADRGIGHAVTSWASEHNHPEGAMPCVFAAARGAFEGGAFSLQRVIGEFTADMHGEAMPDLAEVVEQFATPAPFSRAQEIRAAMRLCERGDDPVRKYVQAVRAGMQAHAPDASSDQTLTHLDAAQQRIRRSLAQVHADKARAKRHPEPFDHWLEGILLIRFFNEFALTALADDLAEQRDHLLQQLDQLKARTRELFAASYEPLSVEEELTIRYGFHQMYLEQFV